MNFEVFETDMINIRVESLEDVLYEISKEKRRSPIKSLIIAPDSMWPAYNRLYNYIIAEEVGAVTVESGGKTKAKIPPLPSFLLY